MDEEKARIAELLKRQVIANIITHWDHPNAKFYPGDEVRVKKNLGDHESKRLKSRIGTYGTVVAVSATKAGKIRSTKKKYHPGMRAEYIADRQYTKYYVLFNNDVIHGFHSHNLKLASREDYVDDIANMDI